MSSESFSYLLWTVTEAGWWLTLTVCMYVRFINYLQDVGFHKEKEIAFSHKQAALMKIGRDGWSAPEL